MLKAKIFIPIFDYTVFFFFSDVHEYKKYEEKIFGAVIDDQSFDGLTVHGKGSVIVRIFVDIGLKDQRLLDVVYHEALHAANYVLDDLMVVQDTKTDELVARLQSYIAGKMIGRVKAWGDQ